MTFPIPTELVVAATAEGRDEWLGGIEATVARFAAEWSLTVGPPFVPGGHTAWVAPVRAERRLPGRGSGLRGGEDLVLKVAWRHPEAEHEGDGLTVWAGRGAVKVYEVVELADTIVLLLEQCRPGRPLRDIPEEEQDLVVASLLARLWVSPPVGHRFRPLGEMCAWWADVFEEVYEGRGSAPPAVGPAGLDPGLVATGIGLYRTLPLTADREVLLCTDLHAGNVLSAEREPWLVIDPKPYVGDPAYDVTQHMLNCSARLHRDPVGLASRMAGLLDLDAGRVRQWLFARCVQESLEWPHLANLAQQLA
ncbi:MAG: aminoglycoside phosphotransferase family protein [Acidimicrobiales bacterium]